MIGGLSLALKCRRGLSDYDLTIPPTRLKNVGRVDKNKRYEETRTMYDEMQTMIETYRNYVREFEPDEYEEMLREEQELAREWESFKVRHNL